MQSNLAIKNLLFFLEQKKIYQQKQSIIMTFQRLF